MRGEKHMTYAMTLDNSWELMNEEEMYDVNGGGLFASGVSTYWTGIAFDAAIIAFGIGVAATSFFKALKLMKLGRVYIRTAITKFVIAAGVTLAESIYGGIMFAVGLISDINSLGSLIANGLDWADGSYDGRINFNF